MLSRINLNYLQYVLLHFHYLPHNYLSTGLRILARLFQIKKTPILQHLAS